MSSFDDDDDLTDIRQLPNLDEEQEESFESLDDIADNLGFTTEDEDESDNFDEDTNLNSISELPDSPPNFDFTEEAGEEMTQSLDDVEEENFDFGANEHDEFIEDEDEDDNSDFDFEESDSEALEEEKPILPLTDFSEEGDDDFQEDYTPKTDFTLEEELSPVPVVETLAAAKTLITNKISTATPHNTPPEDFEEVKNFARDMSSKNFSSEGNPPFSIILRSIKYIEDAESIADVLIKFKIYSADDKEGLLSNLSKGTFLIPRLSEYAAIILCHQLRSYELEILMGLTEEITPPKSYSSNDRGPTSKRTLLANRKHHLNLADDSKTGEIITTTLQNLYDYNIAKYLGVASESKIVDQSILQKSNYLEKEILEQVPEKSQDALKLLRLKKENLNAADSKFGFNFDEIYDGNNSDNKRSGLEYIYADLVSNLKRQAQAANANAVLGITFSTSPVAIDDYLKKGPKYQILCTGNMVWIEKK